MKLCLGVTLAVDGGTFDFVVCKESQENNSPNMLIFEKYLRKKLGVKREDKEISLRKKDGIDKQVLPLMALNDPTHVEKPEEQGYFVIRNKDDLKKI